MDSTIFTLLEDNNLNETKIMISHSVYNRKEDIVEKEENAGY